MTPAELIAALEARARTDLACFAALAVRDERTGAPVRLAQHHRAMLESWTTLARTVSFAPSEYGKSSMLAVFLAYRIGREPSVRIGLLSGTLQQAQRLLRLVSIILHSPVFARVFPGVAVDRVTADELSVTGRSPFQKDVTITAGAFDLSSLLGARFDLVACDDVVSRDSTRTSAARDAAFQAFLAVTASRLSPDGTLHVVNTAEHSDDVPHRLARLPGWSSFAYPALDASGNPTWPERWPLERIEARRLELGPVGFARAMMCQPIDAASLVFSSDDIARALKLGATPFMTPAGGRRCVLGVDPAWTAGATSDESGVVMVTTDDENFRYVVHVEGLRVRHDELVRRVVELARANKATVYVESNGAGGIIADSIGREVPCKALSTTATTKRGRVEALSAEMASGRWVFFQPLGYPSPELRKLVDEVAMFSFEAHCGDRASALLIACEGVRAIESRPKAKLHMLDLHNR